MRQPSCRKASRRHEFALALSSCCSHRSTDAMNSPKSVVALTVRFYFVSLLAFLLFGTFAYLSYSALKRSGYFGSPPLLRRANFQAQEAIGSECPYRPKFGSYTRCEPRSGLRRYFSLKMRPDTINLHHSNQVCCVTSTTSQAFRNNLVLQISQRCSSGGDIEAQDDQKRNSAAEWATSLLRRIRSVERRNSHERQLHTILRQTNLPLATPTPTSGSVTHSPSVATVEKQDSFAYLAPQYANEMDITEILDCYSDTETSFGSVDILETPPLTQHSMPQVAIHGSQSFAPPLRENIRAPLYLNPVLAIKERALLSEPSPKCVADGLYLPTEAHARRFNRTVTPASPDMENKSTMYQKTPRIGSFVWEVAQCADITEWKVDSANRLMTGTVEDRSEPLVL